MKLVKTDWRNCLTDEAVSDVIRIILHSADIKEYNPDQAVHLWKGFNKRLETKPKGLEKEEG